MDQPSTSYETAFRPEGFEEAFNEIIYRDLNIKELHSFAGNALDDLIKLVQEVITCYQLVSGGYEE